MRTPTYEAAITFITINDQRARARFHIPQSLEFEPTIRLVADLFQKSPREVASDCITYSQLTLEAIDEA